MAWRYPAWHDSLWVRPRRGGAALLAATILPIACAACDSDRPAQTAVQATTSTTAAPIPSTTAAAPAWATTGPTSLGVPAVDPFAGRPLIDHVVWTEAADGPRLLVFPTLAGRQTTFPGSHERAWQEVVDLSAEADAPGMRDQFVCHWDWARLVQPNKPSWNLEPWRPAVGYQATVEARCNPGGPER